MAEAGIDVERLRMHPGGFPREDLLVLEDFAELIVRECIERVRSQYIPVRDSTVEGSPNFFHPQLKVRTEREEGIVECGVNSVIALEELIQEQTDKWYKENILGVES
jgi:hypothetical protein